MINRPSLLLTTGEVHHFPIVQGGHLLPRGVWENPTPSERKGWHHPSAGGKERGKGNGMIYDSGEIQ